LYDKNYIRYVDIMKGGEIEIVLQDRPTKWGSDNNCRPSSLTK